MAKHASHSRSNSVKYPEVIRNDAITTVAGSLVKMFAVARNPADQRRCRHNRQKQKCQPSGRLLETFSCRRTCWRAKQLLGMIKIGNYEQIFSVSFIVDDNVEAAIDVPVGTGHVPVIFKFVSTSKQDESGNVTWLGDGKVMRVNCTIARGGVSGMHADPHRIGKLADRVIYLQFFQQSSGVIGNLVHAFLFRRAKCLTANLTSINLIPPVRRKPSARTRFARKGEPKKFSLAS